MSSESRKSPVSGGALGAICRSRPPFFYYITDRTQLKNTTVIQKIRRAIAWGVDFVQIREKDLTDRELFRLCRKAVNVARGSSCKILVNGRADVAIASGAHGAHLPSTGFTASQIKSWVPRRFIIGVSVHSLAEARRATAQGADYLLLGPVFATPSKLRFGRPLGLPLFGGICSRMSIPIVGLGGIRPELVSSVLQAGAVGVAGIRLFQQDISDRSNTREALARISHQVS